MYSCSNREKSVVYDIPWTCTLHRSILIKVLCWQLFLWHLSYVDEYMNVLPWLGIEAVCSNEFALMISWR